MMYDIEKYYNAQTVDEAIELLDTHKEARIIAGGSDVLIRIREGKMAGCTLVGIRDIKEIQGVSLRENGDIYIGAATSFSHITANPVVQKYIPVLGNAVNQVGGPQVRNIGTIGGNICNGAVSADSAPTVFSLGGKVRIVSREGVRLADVEDFYAGPGRVRLNSGDLVTHIVIPKENYVGCSGHYIKYSMRNAMDIATLGCSVVVKAREVSPEKRIIEDIRITFGVAAPVPYRCKVTEEKIKGRKVDEVLLTLIENSVREEINPRDSWRASKAFRLQIAGEIARRALIRALETPTAPDPAEDAGDCTKVPKRPASDRTQMSDNGGVEHE